MPMSVLTQNALSSIMAIKKGSSDFIRYYEISGIKLFKKMSNGMWMKAACVLEKPMRI